MERVDPTVAKNDKVGEDHSYSFLWNTKVKDQNLYDEVVDAIDESDQLKKILTKIVKTSQEND